MAVGSNCVVFDSCSCRGAEAKSGSCSDSSAGVFVESCGTGGEVGGIIGSSDDNGCSLRWSSSWSTRVKEEREECGAVSLVANGASGGSREGNGGFSVVTKGVSVSSVAMFACE